MKKALIEGILNVVYAVIDGTLAWVFWNIAFEHKVTWFQSLIVCSIIINCVRSATRMPSSDK
jgi:hypothetical protein